MRAKTATLLVLPMLIVLLWGSAGLLRAESRPLGLPELARVALHGDPAEAAEAAATLRQAGPAGMEALLAEGGSGDVLDKVCGVRDCADLRLFWYTDLDAAKAAAQASGKPILSLRLMGRLDEEFSCANSRFFRTVFYKNAEINQLLRDGFILHWRSVRPVPRVTIDFGDGTRLERTLTGNSIHYVLDSHGRILDALPGLYGPQAFQTALRRDVVMAQRLAPRNDVLDDRFAEWLSARTAEALRIRAQEVALQLPGEGPESELQKDRPAKLETGSKMMAELPMLRALDNPAKGDVRRETPPFPPTLADLGDEQIQRLGELHRTSVHLDAASRIFLLRKQGITDPQEADRLVDAFEQSVALDEAINLYRIGPAILKKLGDPETLKSFDLEAFNLWVYEEVFRTPVSDPWLGLAPKDVYTALPAKPQTVAETRPQG
jgi:hypothetical protein